MGIARSSLNCLRNYLMRIILIMLLQKRRLQARAFGNTFLNGIRGFLDMDLAIFSLLGWMTKNLSKLFKASTCINTANVLMLLWRLVGLYQTFALLRSKQAKQGYLKKNHIVRDAMPPPKNLPEQFLKYKVLLLTQRKISKKSYLCVISLEIRQGKIYLTIRQNPILL